ANQQPPPLLWGGGCFVICYRVPLLGAGAGVGDLGGHVGILLGKVLGEHIGQLVGLLVVGCLVLPHAAGVQHLGGHAGAAGGVVHVEHIVVLELHIVKAAVQGCGDHGAGVAQLHPLGACGGAAAGPGGVHQVDLGAVLVQLVAQHLGIDLGVHGHEGLAEQGGEGGLGLGDAALGTGQLGGEAGHEVVHGGLLAQAADRGQDAEGVGGQEDDHLGDAALAGDLGVGDIVHGVAHAGVLGQAVVVKVQLAGGGVHDHVLHQGAKLDGPENVGLVLFLQVDALGVAAALKVEDAVGAPAVLVVADQLAAGVGGQGGLAGAGQAEEHGGLVGLGVHVGRAVHGQDVLLGHDVVHG